MKTYSWRTNKVPSWLCLYPTFKEWKQTCKLLCYICIMFVYILPLRNENQRYDTQYPPQLYRLYPTFKEWKQDSIRVRNDSP